jgi:hypothetical protein
VVRTTVTFRPAVGVRDATPVPKAVDDVVEFALGIGVSEGTSVKVGDPRVLLKTEVVFMPRDVGLSVVLLKDGAAVMDAAKEEVVLLKVGAVVSGACVEVLLPNDGAAVKVVLLKVGAAVTMTRFVEVTSEVEVEVHDVEDELVQMPPVAVGRAEPVPPPVPPVSVGRTHELLPPPVPVGRAALVELARYQGYGCCRVRVSV